MQRLEGLDNGNYYIGSCKLTKHEKNIALKNPHCTEYFCNIKKITECTKCINYLINKKK